MVYVHLMRQLLNITVVSEVGFDDQFLIGYCVFVSRQKIKKFNRTTIRSPVVWVIAILKQNWFFGWKPFIEGQVQDFYNGFFEVEEKNEVVDPTNTKGSQYAA